MGRSRVLGVMAFVWAGVTAAGCGSVTDSLFGDEDTAGPPTDYGQLGSAQPGAPSACSGLECQQVQCAGGGTTSLTGKVFDPSGTVPLYNAVVYVPNAALEPFSAGVSCDRCGTALSGKPITTALTDAKGEFVLANVPVGVDVPVVVQIGRFRRKVIVPSGDVARCEQRALAPEMTRLPRSRAEGDIPKIAITTGYADSLECFVRKLGIDANEFTNATNGGRINLYQGLREDDGPKYGSKIDTATPSAQSLWDSEAELKKYDIVILSCEGDENAATKSSQAKENLRRYLDAGGRVFASHFHYEWYKNGAGDLPKTANWIKNENLASDDVSVDLTFAKGQAFSQWLDVVGATTAPGSNQVAMTELRRNVTSVPGTGLSAGASRRWLYTGSGQNEQAKFYSFNTPIGIAPEQQCGRAVYTDIHVSSGDIAEEGVIPDFPANCITSGFTPQEKALLFLMMDLASCIQDEGKAPVAPPAVVN